ncbi:hypothetical protein [Blastococcus haudaquaticus]|uniref:Uncharacterized protein n=1 Tax=Blastococcus haudaquaticus TaxID=1938745 RepID=A0A286GGU7_9ACTN|nr:hypothetical protein [Blastococcus haudaquaticus]SOD94456.1 hypothetical protein SAMN06272739_0822 [Blastococcus haudaquaticus]
MRRSLTVCRSGLSLAAAVVLLTACGGSDGEDAASSESSEASSSAAETSAGASDSEFCTEAADLQEQISSTFTGQSDPNTLPTVLSAAAEQIREIEPPAELEADWTTFGDGIEQVAEAASAVDFNDPNAVAGFQQEIAGLQAGFGEAFTNVDTYLSEECGIGTDATDPAAPTS